jgi:Protein of unknown function (DUF732)
MTSLFTQAPAALKVRPPSPLRSVWAGLVLGLALLGVVAATTPTARADADSGSNFLGALSAKGITFASGPAAIAAGREVCGELDQGKQTSDVANEVMSRSNLDSYHAGFFIGASIGAMCPRHSQ